MNLDFTELFKISVSGVPIVLVILGLVEWFKRLGLKGNVLLLVSMGLGLLIGTGYYITQSLPQAAAEWFAAVVVGLAYGLIASGVYDVLKNVLQKKE